MGQANLQAQNATIEIDISRFKNGAIAATTGATNVGTANFVVEVSGANAPGGAKEWITPVVLTDPTTGSQISALLGASKSGWADLPGYSAVRIRRTDATGGNGYVSLEHREG